MKEKIMGTFSYVFKEELEPHDRMKVEPVKIKLKKEHHPFKCKKV